MNLLLSFAENRTDMIQYFKRAIGNTGKVFASGCTPNYSLTQADGWLIAPHACDNSYVSVLTDYCKKNNISAIVPLSDADLLVLSKNKNKLQGIGISIVVSDESVIKICMDRWETFLFLKSTGIKHSKSYIDMDAAKHDIEAGSLSFPLYLKPRLPHIAKNAIDVYTLEELDLFYRKIEKTILNLSDLQKDKTIIIQEEIHGDKYGVCIFNDLKGNYVTASALQKLSSANDETTFARVENIKPFEHVINMFLSELKHIASFEIDCCLQDSGVVIVSDVYARFGSHYPFWHVAGADFPKQIVGWLNECPLSPDIINPIVGVKGCKEWRLPVLFDYECFK